MDKFYITTPIYYANSRPHVGSAYTTIVCDVIARYKRMCGYEVAYLTGTDEHGVNIERAAEKLGITESELVNRNEKIFRDLWKLLGISNQPYFEFIRTTEEKHARAVQNLVRRTMRRTPDAIYKAKYEGRYCIHDNLYVSDTPEPADCQICGRPAELISEENYFFRLSAYQGKLLDLYKNNPEWVQPDFRMNEVRSFVEAGLKDVSISRKSIKWGIPWPDDPQHVFYVWYDALTSYLSGIGFVDGKPASAGGHDSAAFTRFWPADVHMIGKEIIRFHAVYWPAFLMAAELPLPKKIFAHGWLLFEQEKMSKSKGNVAYPEPIVKVLGNDALRYYLLRETVFGHDGNFSREALITRYNADLANGLGNLASRVLTMITSYFDGRIPDTDPNHPLARTLDWQFGRGKIEEVRRFYDIDVLQFHFALALIWSEIAELDGALTSTAPWTKVYEESMRAEAAWILYYAVQNLYVITVLSHPVIPEATQKIWEQLGQTGKLADVRIDQLKWGELRPGTKIGKPEAVFPRVDKKEAWERIEAMENEIRNPASAPSAATPPKAEGSPATSHSPLATGTSPSATPPQITIDDFAKINFRVGVIQSAEKVAGADKLLKVMVDLGDEVRQIVSGIATAYTPEELAGRKVVVVTNLAPRKLRGVESNGMILAASAGPDGKPVLCTFTEDIPAGAKVK